LGDDANCMLRNPIAAHSAATTGACPVLSWEEPAWAAIRVEGTCRPAVAAEPPGGCGKMVLYPYLNPVRVIPDPP